MEFPEITDYIGLEEATLKEIRKRKLEALSKMYPNKRIIVTKDNQVFIEKSN